MTRSRAEGWRMILAVVVGGTVTLVLLLQAAVITGRMQREPPRINETPVEVQYVPPPPPDNLGIRSA